MLRRQSKSCGPASTITRCRLLLLIVSVWLGSWALTACGDSKDVIIKTAAGVELTADDIDRDPLALLPGGAIGVARIDAQALFRSAFGMRLVQLAQSRAPVPPSAGFVPERDLFWAYVGFYSMQGADFAGVATGQFDPEAIKRAADGTQQTPLGAPLVRTEYAGRVLYTAANIGFTVLTRRTALFGNETGIRRALDRIAEGRVQNELGQWAMEVIADPKAPMAGVADFTTQPLVSSANQSLPFLNGLQRGRVLGNFEPPGVNFAGTLSYPDPNTATQAEASIQRFRSQVASLGFLATLLGIGQPIQKLDTRVVGSDTQFVLGVSRKYVMRPKIC